MWYNATTRQLQSNPPWHGWVSEEVKQRQYADWQEVANEFVMPINDEDIKKAKLAEIQSLLSETNADCIKYVDGSISGQEFESIKAFRNSLRKARLYLETL